MKLNPKEKAFADRFLECGNATEAAKVLGVKSIQMAGYRYINRPAVQAYLKDHEAGAATKYLRQKSVIQDAAEPGKDLDEATKSLERPQLIEYLSKYIARPTIKEADRLRAMGMLVSLQGWEADKKANEGIVLDYHIYLFPGADKIRPSEEEETKEQAALDAENGFSVMTDTPGTSK